MPNPKKALLVLTSHGDLGGLRPTGYHVGEAAHPWKELTEAGIVVDLVSTAGGQPPMDGRDPDDEVQNAFLSDPRVAEQLANTPRLADVDPSEYDAVVFAGGPARCGTSPATPTSPGWSARCGSPTAWSARCATAPPLSST